MSVVDPLTHVLVTALVKIRDADPSDYPTNPLSKLAKQALIDCDRLRASQAQQVAGGDACWCSTCRPVSMNPPSNMRMVLCPTCGNKRCPKATFHGNACTGSNKSGQKGSSWENYPKHPTPEADAVAPVVIGYDPGSPDGDMTAYAELDRDGNVSVRLENPAATEAKAGEVTDAMVEAAGAIIWPNTWRGRAGDGRWARVRNALEAALAPSSPTGEPAKAGE